MRSQSRAPSHASTDAQEPLYTTRPSSDAHDTFDDTSSSSAPTPKPSDEETVMFKQQVAEWLKLDDQVRKLNIAIKERRTHQKALTTKVQQFMIKYGYDNLNTNQGVIKSNVRTVRQPLKLGDVRCKIDELYATVDQSLQAPLRKIVEDIFEAERPTVTKQSLNRRIPKVSMSLEL